MGDLSSSPEWNISHNYVRAPPNTAAASPNNYDVTAEAASSDPSEPRPRRNTSQSVSCPDPPLLPLQCSPSRSVSQPMPSPRAPPPSCTEELASEAPCKMQAQVSEKPDGPKQTTIEAKAVPGATRGRGSRGRGHRGRYRGKGRRNASTSKQNQDGGFSMELYPARSCDKDFKKIMTVGRGYCNGSVVGYRLCLVSFTSLLRRTAVIDW
ncbi:hypothetical protein EV127DRAFT_188790 [Xylaria flabelliformis]|nr:hypothetical protein EV127DRAFT_188790 [Xylaria flabelliformis]